MFAAKKQKIFGYPGMIYAKVFIGVLGTEDLKMYTKHIANEHTSVQ